MVTTRKGETLIEADEQPGKARPEKIPHLKPAFARDGTVTAANASSISDGAAALVVTSGATAEEKGLSPRARILGHASHSHAPQWFTTAPVGAMQKVLEAAGWSVDEVDLFEINEAFASVVLAWQKETGVSLDKVNVKSRLNSLSIMVLFKLCHLFARISLN